MGFRQALPSSQGQRGTLAQFLEKLWFLPPSGQGLREAPQLMILKSFARDCSGIPSGVQEPSQDLPVQRPSRLGFKLHCGRNTQ